MSACLDGWKDGRRRCAYVAMRWYCEVRARRRGELSAWLFIEARISDVPTPNLVAGTKERKRVNH